MDLNAQLENESSRVFDLANENNMLKETVEQQRQITADIEAKLGITE